ncbi:MAG: hypothetical protein Q7T61_01495 [Caulobacter sp.]|nr:hypothetical protein [Caulobacter sp.]
MRRILLLCAIVGLLGACTNVVFSDAPLVAGDERPAEHIRDGRWVGLHETCEGLIPPVAWAECGDGILVQGGAISPSSDTEQGIALSSGVPTLMQVRFQGDRLTDRSLNDFGAMQLGRKPSREGPPPIAFVYSIVEPLRKDATGQVIEVRLRDLQCGPPDETDMGRGTRRPFAEVAMDVEDNNCTVETRAALDSVARQSLALPRVKDERYVWVRDLTPDEARKPVSPPSPSR